MKKAANNTDSGFFGNDEINIELFAGCGGFGLGSRECGTHFDYAINHSNVALAIHRANFPETRQLVCDVFEYSPQTIAQGRSCGLAHFSPDCTFFSRSRGGSLSRHSVCGDDMCVDHTKLDIKNAERVRGLILVALGWAMSDYAPRRMTIENVEEITSWCRVKTLPDGKIVPDLEHDGEYYNAFIAMLTVGVSPDDPALPVFRSFLQPFLGEQYDESRLVKGLGYDVDTRLLSGHEFGAPTTRARWFLQARRDGLPLRWPEPTHGNPKRFPKLRKWRTAAEVIDWSKEAPSIFDTRSEIMEKYGVRANRPLSEKTMIRIARGFEKFVLNGEPHIVDKNGNRVAPYVQTYYGNTKTSGARGNTIDEPMRTITAQGLRHGVVSAYLANLKGTDPHRMPIGNTLDEPVTTITASDTHAVVTGRLSEPPANRLGYKEGYRAVHAIKMKGQNAGYPVAEPNQTITASGTRHGLIASSLIKFYGTNRRGQGIDAPLDTITTKERFGLASSPLSDWHALSERERYDAWNVARLLEVYGSEKAPMLGGVPLPRRRYVEVAGAIVSTIGLRMLDPTELKLGQGFPENFVLDVEYDTFSRGKKIKKWTTKTEKVRAIGNSVVPQVAAALIRCMNEVEAEAAASSSAA